MQIHNTNTQYKYTIQIHHAGHQKQTLHPPSLLPNESVNTHCKNTVQQHNNKTQCKYTIQQHNTNAQCKNTMQKHNKRYSGTLHPPSPKGNTMQTHNTTTQY